MLITPNMGLTSWNSLSDTFDHTALENNNAILDQHDHSNGKGRQIGTAGIANGAITTAKLANPAAIYVSGILAARPVAAGVAPGTFYYATDTALLYESNGASWFTVTLAAAWVPLTLATNVFPGPYTPSARQEADVIRLKGQLSNNTGGSITVGTTWATISTGLRPSQLVIITGNLTPGGGGASTAAMLEITTGGLLSLSVAAPANAFISLDGVTYTLS